ncbi:laccase, multicopper oxidase, benzenediol:oxygen oxidorectuctase [Marasmius tenuissimus]|uniref:Laccase, multicopper oxidase, benzenediol:oxygen oxidorectuctase n=1 Tax=Marasmius tenuissimus TaxID=585030 RepID=A0ABR2ZWA7_9AGAR
MTDFKPLLSFITLSVLFGASYAVTVGPISDMVIDTAVVAPDGFSRTAVLAGGTVDGPLITAQKGERIKVNVINNLDHPDFLKSTSIHWHGFFQNDGANWADGPAFVNQCPIAHKTSFLYDYPTANQAGTFWYHSHLSTQYCDGLRGVIVVYDPEDPFKSMYDVDDETTVISLSDWYHTPAKQLVLPTHDSVLINGLGRWKDGERTDLAVIQVEQGKRCGFSLRVSEGALKLIMLTKGIASVSSIPPVNQTSR